MALLIGNSVSAAKMLSLVQPAILAMAGASTPTISIPMNSSF